MPVSLGLHLSQTLQQSGPVRDLYIQARAGVQLQNQWAQFPVEHQVHALITQSRQLMATCRDVQEAVPMWDPYSGHWVAAIGMLDDIFRGC